MKTNMNSVLYFIEYFATKNSVEKENRAEAAIKREKEGAG